jgi:hypothetical protein
MRKLAFPLFFCATLLGFSLPSTTANAQATRTWVSGVGDDANPCSRTAPCKTFAGAISKTAAGGEIDCLDPGGFGAVTITKSITIDCGTFPGGILSSLTNGVIVNAGVNDRVVLRNLVINGAGNGLNGIRFLAGRELVCDRCVIQQVTTVGIDVSKTAFGVLYVKNSVFIGMPTAIRMSTTSSFVLAMIDNSHFFGMTTNGVQTNSSGAVANVSNSVFENIGGAALLASTSGAIINADRNILANNTTGVNASISGATIRLSDNYLNDNTTGINVVAGATFLSANNNKIVGGTAGSNPTGSYTIK